MITFQDLIHVVKCSKDLPSIDVMDAIVGTIDKNEASTNFRKQQKNTGKSELARS